MPNILTLAAAENALPVEVTMMANLPEVFNSLKVVRNLMNESGWETPILATNYMIDNYIN